MKLGRLPSRRPRARLLRGQPPQVVLRPQGLRVALGPPQAPREDQAPGGQPLLPAVLQKGVLHAGSDLIKLLHGQTLAYRMSLGPSFQL